MERREAIDLLAAWGILSVAFANLLGGLEFKVIMAAFATVGIGFLLHELAHRVVAQNFGLEARFEADYQMLLLAFLVSFLGFIFAAPGAVNTLGNRTEREQMLISVAGPLTNIALAILFYPVPGQTGHFGFRINAWLALFNMIPFAGLDGESVLEYDKKIYATVTLTALFLVFVL